MTDKPSNPTAEAMKKALAAKKTGGGKPSAGGGFKPAQHAEKLSAHQSASANKPAFRKASERG